MLILFGYIQQMARAGTVEALNSDYARTATLKGLPRGVMIRRHVLRNSLLPTITVIATQTGYLIGGLVLVETLFHYNGIGSLIYTAATQKDFPMLEACVLVDRRGLHGGHAGRGHPVHAAQPAHPLPGGRMSIGTVPVESAAAVSAAGADLRRQEFLRELVRRKAFIAGVVIIGFWILAAIFGSLVVQDPLAQNLSNINQAPSSAHLFGTDQLGPRRVRPGHRRLAADPHHRAAGDRCWGRCWAPGSDCSWATSAARSTTSSAASSRRSWRCRSSSPASSARSRSARPTWR